MNNKERRWTVLACAVLLGVPTTILAGQAAPPHPNRTISLEGTIQKIDAAANTVIVKTVDGAERTFSFTKRTVVHGAKATAAASRAALSGLEQDSHVVVHYVTTGTTSWVQEIDRIGDDGLRLAEGTVDGVDRKGKQLTIVTADGARETFRLTENATVDAGREIAQGAEKSTKVSVYYTEEAGHKVAHFFKKIS